MSERSDESLLAQLDELELESKARRDELREIAAQLPATLSRRALLRTIASDLRTAPDKRAIVKRGGSKVVNAPLHAAKRVQLRVRPKP